MFDAMFCLGSEDMHFQEATFPRHQAKLPYWLKHFNLQDEWFNMVVFEFKERCSELNSVVSGSSRSVDGWLTTAAKTILQTN